MTTYKAHITVTQSGSDYGNEGRLAELREEGKEKARFSYVQLEIPLVASAEGSHLNRTRQ